MAAAAIPSGGVHLLHPRPWLRSLRRAARPLSVAAASSPIQQSKEFTATDETPKPIEKDTASFYPKRGQTLEFVCESLVFKGKGLCKVADTGFVVMADRELPGERFIGRVTRKRDNYAECCSCGMAVHQRCYGVREDVDSSWMCSWCKWKKADWNTETPCLLCPKQGGALKPVQKRGFESDNEEFKLEFAHLFCCQWMAEVYLEDTKVMEPIMNMIDSKDSRRKLICYLCKVKYGACV